MTQLAPAPSTKWPESRSHGPKPGGAARGGRDWPKRGGGYKKYNRKGSGGSSRSRGDNAASMKQSTSSRSSGGTASGGATNRGINVMPF